jgi:hypothetical protein
MAGGQRRPHQAIARIGDQRRAGVGHQRHALARGEGAQQPRLARLPGGVAVRDGRRGDAVVAGELGEDARVLGGDQVGRAQHVERAQGDVAQIADRRCDNVKAGSDAAGRRFTSRLPTGSL